jgi:hypothetical protein
MSVVKRAAYGLILAVGLARLALGLWLGFRPFDDTYITFRYALNLASGFGFVYNVGEHVLGTSSPLWAMALAALRLAHVPIELGSLALALTLDVATAVLLFRLLALLDYGVEIGFMAAVLLLCWFDYFSLARSGMETSCFVFLAIAALQAIVSSRFARAAACSALACLTRPEGAVLVVLLMIALWRVRSTVAWRDVAACLALLLIISGGWAIYALGTFGSVVPQSVVAKAAMARDPALRRFSWLNLALFFLKGQYGGEIFERTYLQLTPVTTALSGVAAAALLLDLIGARNDLAVRRTMALLFFPAGYVAGLALSHAFTFFPWYYGPIYPFAAVLAMVGAATLCRGNRRIVAGVCVLLVSGQLAAAWLVKLPASRGFWIEGYMEAADPVPRDPEVRVAALEIGAVGWRVWPAHVLDLAGLVTPDAVGVPPDQYVRSMRPDYLILRTDNGAEFLALAAQAAWFAQGYGLVVTRHDPYTDREFRTYRIRR